MFNIIRKISEKFKYNSKSIKNITILLDCEFDAKVKIIKSNSGKKKIIIINSLPSEKKQKKIIFQYNKYFSTLYDNENISIRFWKMSKLYTNIKSKHIKIKQGGLIWSKDNHSKSIQLCNAVVIFTKGL